MQCDGLLACSPRSSLFSVRAWSKSNPQTNERLCLPEHHHGCIDWEGEGGVRGRGSLGTKEKSWTCKHRLGNNADKRQTAVRDTSSASTEKLITGRPAEAWTPGGQRGTGLKRNGGQMTEC